MVAYNSRKIGLYRKEGFHEYSGDFGFKLFKTFEDYAAISIHE